MCSVYFCNIYLAFKAHHDLTQRTIFTQVHSKKTTYMKLNMTSVVYTKEQLNYFRICYIATNVVPEGLRLIFKQEWDNRYKRTRFGEWKDTLQNGRDFYEGESKENQERNKDSLTTMINGNSQEWDCTMLFYAILHSDCIYHLRGAVRSSVHIIREFRNLSFAHVTRGQLSDPEFQT